MNFLYLLKAENGAITPDRRSIRVGANGHYDYGFCQVNDGYHPKIVKDPRFFSDWRWQMDRCLELYRGGTTFYGIKRFQNDAKFKKQIISSFTKS